METEKITRQRPRKAPRVRKPTKGNLRRQYKRAQQQWSNEL